MADNGMFIPGEGTFGKKGPENALRPRMPERGLSKENSGLISQTLLLETELGFDDDRKHLKELSDNEFKGAVGSVDGRMDEELFVTTVTQRWHLERRMARACFLAGDIDRSKHINRHEYLILREAFVHEVAGDEEHPRIRELRLRAILLRYDSDRDGSLSRGDVLDMIRDLCAGTSHVERIASSLLAEEWEGEAKEATTVERAIQMLGLEGSLELKLRENHLSTEDLFRNFRADPLHSKSAFRRVVYDGRAETAKPPSGGGDHGGHAPAGAHAPRVSQHGTRGSILAAAGGRTKPLLGDALREGVSSASVPGYAVNEALTLDADLRAVGGWRGPLAVQRASPDFGLASSVIENAMQLAMKLRAETDVPCDEWMEGGAALDALLGPGEEHQADAAVSLAGICKRALTAQPTLVEVRRTLLPPLLANVD